MKGKRSHKTQGRSHPDDMTSLSLTAPGRDPHAHESHHQMNKTHRTPGGLNPPEHYDDGGEGETTGLEGGNSEYC